MNESDTAGTPIEVDVDDVEAHGVREVMVGLSAAAVLTGGVAAVVTAGDGPGTTSRATISADAAGTDLTDAELAASSTDVAGTKFRAAGPSTSVDADGVSSKSASSIADDVDDADVKAPSFLGSRLDRADAAVDSTVQWTRDVRDTTLDSTRTTVQNTRATVRNAPQTVRDVRSTAIGNLPTVNEVVNDVNTVAANTVDTVDATIVLAGDTVRGLEGSVNTVIARIQPGAGAGVDTRAMTGWVTVSAGGQEIARAQVQDGQATLTYQAPRADLPLTVSFSGSDLVRAPSITL